MNDPILTLDVCEDNEPPTVRMFSFSFDEAPASECTLAGTCHDPLADGLLVDDFDVTVMAKGNLEHLYAIVDEYRHKMSRARR
jgi:hypothetical protein